MAPQVMVSGSRYVRVSTSAPGLHQANLVLPEFIRVMANLIEKISFFGLLLPKFEIKLSRAIMWCIRLRTQASSVVSENPGKLGSRRPT
jgi:hypothetical protein